MLSDTRDASVSSVDCQLLLYEYLLIKHECQATHGCMLLPASVPTQSLGASAVLFAVISKEQVLLGD